MPGRRPDPASGFLEFNIQMQPMAPNPPAIEHWDPEGKVPGDEPVDQRSTATSRQDPPKGGDLPATDTDPDGTSSEPNPRGDLYERIRQRGGMLEID